MRKLITVLVIISMISCADKKDSSDNSMVYRMVDQVDPFIGTADHGHVYPGATVPFGMVQLSPDNGTQGWDWCSGYNWIDSTIVGFSHTHLSGTGIGDLADISIMPFVGIADLGKTGTDHKSEDFASLFSHDNEEAHPGYYSVFLEDPQIRVELSATERTGIHRYTYEAGMSPSLIINLAFAINFGTGIEHVFKVYVCQAFN